MPETENTVVEDAEQVLAGAQQLATLAEERIAVAGYEVGVELAFKSDFLKLLLKWLDVDELWRAYQRGTGGGKDD